MLKIVAKIPSSMVGGFNKTLGMFGTISHQIVMSPAIEYVNERLSGASEPFTREMTSNYLRNNIIPLIINKLPYDRMRSQSSFQNDVDSMVTRYLNDIAITLLLTIKPHIGEGELVRVEMIIPHGSSIVVGYKSNSYARAKPTALGGMIGMRSEFSGMFYKNIK